eukprot:TRINITY_DN1640_c0_g1_i2.p3 TRINITY_DN1640_c0_g1~~TRINITY_DN1640_c0_g1_i2.p3  ORF type:complete len:174 (+),score=63.74 TRINITY_DN1640_c0_g1_i2:235-756(+)
MQSQTTRSVGKQYDWELERFRLGKKYPDRGNKRRFIKNFFRFLKHPFGYAWWKTYKWRQAKGRLMVLTITFGMIFTVFKYKVDAWNIAKKNHWLLVSGKNLEGTGTIRPGYDDDRWAKQPMPMTSFLYYDLPGYKIVVNPCRDQNYRKYFELRKRYGIKPPNVQQRMLICMIL